MIVKFKEYSLIPSVNAVERFDLYRTIKVTATKKLVSGVKAGQIYEKEEELGYGYSLESGIGKIIAYELIKKNDVVDLKKYLSEYRAVKSEILSLLEA